MVQFLSVNFFSWISSIFVGFFKSSHFFFVSLFINIVYKPRNIPVQVRDDCRLLITIVFIEQCNIKEFPVHGLYNMWKTFSLLYRPSTVNPVCHDAAYNSSGLSSCVPHTDQHPLGEPANQARCWLSCRLSYKKLVLLPTEPTI